MKKCPLCDINYIKDDEIDYAISLIKQVYDK